MSYIILGVGAAGALLSIILWIVSGELFRRRGKELKKKLDSIYK